MLPNGVGKNMLPRPAERALVSVTQVEYLLASHAAPLNLPDEISVEHILPQNPDKVSQWIQDFPEEQREQWLHRLGNPRGSPLARRSHCFAACFGVEPMCIPSVGKARPPARQGTRRPAPTNGLLGFAKNRVSSVATAATAC